MNFPLKLNKENTPCPEEWKKKLENKTVFLLNTHFTIGSQSGLDLYSNEGLEIFDIFNKNLNIALIWRPHPMTRTVLKVYSPEKYEIFKKMLDMIENSSNMVMDFNDTYAASFVYSDALISEFSSIIDQYILMDKPILQFVDKPLEKALMDFSNGIDTYRDNREFLRKNYQALADGFCGKRVAQKVVEDFNKEISSN